MQDLTELAHDGKLKVGGDYVYSLEERRRRARSVNKRVPKADIAKTNAVAKQIGAGKIKVKPIVKF